MIRWDNRLLETLLVSFQNSELETGRTYPCSAAFRRKLHSVVVGPGDGMRHNDEMVTSIGDLEISAQELFFFVAVTGKSMALPPPGVPRGSWCHIEAQHWLEPGARYPALERLLPLLMRPPGFELAQQSPPCTKRNSSRGSDAG